MPRQNFPGAHGTTFDDWSKTLLERFNKDTRLERVGKVINAWKEDKLVAKFDFENSTGYVEHSDNPTSLELLENLPNFSEMSLDERIKVE